MRVHLVNPSDVSFGVAIITPRWLYVLAAATPPMWGDPILTDETLEVFDPAQVEAGDVVGIGIHTANALRGYQVGRLAREQGAFVVYGGIHATLYPDEAHELGGAHAVVRGDGDSAWATVLEECAQGGPKRVYEAGRVEAMVFGRPGGTSCREIAICGHRCRQFAAVRNTARSAPCGAPTVRSRVNELLTS